MTDLTLKRLKNCFAAIESAHPSLRSYMIIDSCRLDDDAKFQLSEINDVNLWHEDIRDETDNIALHLVTLAEQKEHIDWLLQLKNEAVFFLFSPYGAEALLNYYSAFTHINLEESEGESCKAIFGVFDPQIIANYLSTLYSHEKIQEFFAGIGVIFAPKIENAGHYYIAYQDNERLLNTGDFELATIDNKHSLAFNNIQLPNNQYGLAIQSERYIDYQQYQIFQEIERDNYLARAYQELAEEPYTLKATLDPEKEPQGLVMSLYQEARSIGITSEGGVYHYLLFGLIIGRNLAGSKVHQGLAEMDIEKQKVDKLKEFISQCPKKEELAHGC